MESKFDIIFRGDVITGNNIADVKQRLAQLFKIDAAKVDALFTGRAVPLKKNVDQATAEKYKAILMKAGAQVSIKDVTNGDVPKKAQRPNPAPDQSSSQPSTPQPSTPQQSISRQSLDEDQPLSLKERLAKAAEEEEVLSKIKAKAEQKALAEDSGGLTLAPVGSILGAASSESSVSVVDVNVNHLTLKPSEGELLEPGEKKPEVVANIDVSDLDIAAVGADLIAASEKVVQEIKAIEIGDFGLADVGSDLITAAEKPPGAKVIITDADFDLAPVGSDVGQIKKAAPPPPPDTSSLSLSE